MKKESHFRTIDIAYIGMFTALIAVCSWISIPLTVPITLQTFAVFTTVALLGMKRGSLSVLVYILLGTIGVPVFAGFSGGIGAVLGATGGYIIGFLGSALVVGGIMKVFGKSIPVMIVSMVAGLVVCYAFGTIWFMVVYAQKSGAVGLLTTLGWCVFPFIIPDLCKIALAILVDKRVEHHVKL